jgi:hypothetical protein
MRAVLLLATWFALVVVWVSTCVELGLSGRWQYGALAAVDAALLVVLYLAEGMELAATDLLDKDPAQIANERVRVMLREIQVRPDYFYANRQVFVVVIIAFTSLTTAYPWIFVPGQGRVDAPGASFWFGLALTTLTVLWFSQVTPKRLAIMNSEVFLGQCRPIWTLIRLVGALGLPAPTDLMVAFARSRTRFRTRRLLSPGRAEHYWVQARLYGYALDRLTTTVTLERDGGATVRKRFQVVLLHGPHPGVYGAIEMPGQLCRPPRARVVGLFLADVPERLLSLSGDLDAIFEERPDALERVPPSRWRHEVTVRQRSTGTSTIVYCEISGESLPDSLHDADPSGGLPRLAALVYELEARCGPGDDEPLASWSESVELPCRLLTIEATAVAGLRSAILARRVDVTMAQSYLQRTEESASLSRQAIANRGRVEVSYPLVGAAYGLHWTTARIR